MLENRPRSKSYGYVFCQIAAKLAVRSADTCKGVLLSAYEVVDSVTCFSDVEAGLVLKCVAMCLFGPGMEA